MSLLTAEYLSNIHCLKKPSRRTFVSHGEDLQAS